MRLNSRTRLAGHAHRFDRVGRADAQVKAEGSGHLVVGGPERKFGLVDAALLCAAFSLEDPLLCLRERRSAPEAVLSEGAGALVLVAGGEPTDWSRFADEAGDVCYGVADLILTVSLRENSIRKEFP